MVVDKNSAIPLYYQIKEKILSDIHEGKYQIGQQLPPEMELAEEFNVSRPTVRQAINELVFENILWRERGRGTFINKPMIKSNLEILTPFVEEIESQGLTPGVKVIEKELADATEGIAKALNIKPNDQVIKFERIRLVNDDPVILRTSFFSYKLIPQLLDEELEPLYPVIQKYGFDLTRAEQTLHVVQAREDEARKLGVAKGFPLLLWEGIVYSKEGIPIELVKSLYRSDRYQFHVIQRRGL